MIKVHEGKPGSPATIESGVKVHLFGDPTYHCSLPPGLSQAQLELLAEALQRVAADIAKNTDLDMARHALNKEQERRWAGLGLGLFRGDKELMRRHMVHQRAAVDARIETVRKLQSQ